MLHVFLNYSKKANLIMWGPKHPMRPQQPVKPAPFEEDQYFGLTTGAWPKTNGHAAYVRLQGSPYPIELRH